MQEDFIKFYFRSLAECISNFLARNVCSALKLYNKDINLCYYEYEIIVFFFISIFSFIITTYTWKWEKKKIL